MKEKLHLACLSGGLMLGMFAFLQSGVYAQGFIADEGSELLQLGRMESFQDPEINEIPYEGHKLFHDVTPRKLDKNNFVKMYSIETNPALKHKLLESKKAQGENPEVFKSFDLSWGTFRTIEDNKMYYFTQENEDSSVDKYLYKSATITVFDDNLEQLKQFKISSSDRTQYFRMTNTVSNKVFNNDSKWEFVIAVHGFAETGSGPSSCRDTVCIVNEDSEILHKIADSTGASIDQISSSKYNLTVYMQMYAELHDDYRINIYNPRELCKTPDVTPDPVFSYSLMSDLTTYSQGPVFNMMNIEGEKYYVSSYYEKPFVKNGDSHNPEWEMDNRFIIKLYDTSFNVVKEVKLPLFGQKDHPISMSNITSGFYEYAITKNTFNNDDKFEFVYGMSRYYVECDCEKVDWYLVNEDGEIIKEMVKTAGGTIKLQNIPGQSNEYAVLIGGSEKVEAIKMYKMPEMEEVYTFPAMHNGELLSLAFERIATKDGYNYIFGLGKGESANNTVYGGIAYYNQKGEMTKRVRIDLGPKAALFTPIITAETLNPYNFAADSEVEYLYFAKKYIDGGGIEGGFGISNEHENLYYWGDDGEWGFSGAGIQTNADMNVLKYLYVSYMKNDRSAVQTRFYTLPLIAASLKGAGTAESPYLIGSASELDLIRNNPSAFYELTSDIDMSKFTGVGGSGFVPVDKFTGVLDGKNHVIRNIILDKSGMFNYISGGTVKNLQMENVVWSDLSVGSLGAIAGNITNGRIDNCHVRFNLESDVKLSNFGALIGKVASYSYISNSSFEGNLELPNSTGIGCISGQIATGSVISNCFTKGNIYAKDGVGGISGKFMTGASVQNCYSTVNVKGVSDIGGIVGSGNGVIKNNYATGKVESDLREGEKWLTGAGGIAGSITGSMHGESLLTNNVALNSSVMMPSEFGRVAYTDYDETTGESQYIKSNYAVADMKVGTSNDDLNVVDEGDNITVGIDRIHGQSVAEKDLTQKFYEDMGWKFGSDSISPWVMTDKYPELWFEYRVRGVNLDKDELTLGVGEKFTLKAEVYPEKAENKNVRFESSDLKVVTVDRTTGELSARNVGTATVKVITEDGSYTAECAVNVVIAVEKVEISEETVHMMHMERKEISATVTPDDATNKNIFWKSLNPSVVTVSGGVLMATYPGEAKVVALAEGGNASDTCTVFVYAPIQDLYLNETEIELDKETPSFRLVANIKPVESAGMPLTWTSEDETVAKVDQEGLVTAVSVGETIITVMAMDNEHSAQCLVIVNENVGIDNVALNSTMVYNESSYIKVRSEAEIESIAVVNSNGAVELNQAVNGEKVANIESVNLLSGTYILNIRFCNGNSISVKIVL